jgi:hypothetical protein
LRERASQRQSHDSRADDDRVDLVHHRRGAVLTAMVGTGKLMGELWPSGH